jgi:Na+-transporting NADH:ubiquinone oxidoreductase subunit C
MNHSNTYIFIYSTIMVVVVAAVLSLAATSLKPLQDKNRTLEKKQDILKSVGIISTPAQADELYAKYITESFVIKNGAQTDGDAFTVHLKSENAKPLAERSLPVYKAQKGDSVFLIMPLLGSGLWGPVWGYMSVAEELASGKKIYGTVYGATFDHSGETPGLGAEISMKAFQDQFKGKKIFDEAGQFKSVSVLKGANTSNNPHAVDGISGGTITSNGVSEMIYDCMEGYKTYLQSLN